MEWWQQNLVRTEATFGTLYTREGDLITDQIREFGAHTRPELAFLCNVIEAGDRIFDIGAHIGSFTVPLAQRTGPAGTVIAVEALPENFALLVENISANGLNDTVKAIRAIVAPGSEMYMPTLERTNSGATFFALADETGEPSVELDDIVTKTVPPDLIKIYVEGLEFHILRSSKTVHELRPIVYAEICEGHLARYGSTISDFEHLFRDLGYRFFRNAGPRNARDDVFSPIELNNLSDGGAFFDVLAVPGDSSRLPRVLDGC
jgi:FkbM family methyltransferase